VYSAEAAEVLANSWIANTDVGVLADGESQLTQQAIRPVRTVTESGVAATTVAENALGRRADWTSGVEGHTQSNPTLWRARMRRRGVDDQQIAGLEVGRSPNCPLRWRLAG
jgi:hypothetical protein